MVSAPLVAQYTLVLCLCEVVIVLTTSLVCFQDIHVFFYFDFVSVSLYMFVCVRVYACVYAHHTIIITNFVCD